jgi:redox-sensitive bicupin YhaK (pirin superfamily)
MREIKQVATADKVDMGGVPILQSLPSRAAQEVDPFLLIHHWRETYPGGQHPSQVGVPPHPHKGFSPVTFIYEGALRHLDSKGNDSIVRGGGTQWMFSDKGIFHSERPDMALAKEGGKLELIQFWVNSPAAHKEDTPRYIPLAAEDTPVVQSDDGKVSVGVVTGTFGETEGPITPHSPMKILRLTGEADGHLHFSVPASYQALAYVLEGKVRIGETVLSGEQIGIFEQGEETAIEMQWEEPGRVLFLSGEPLGEPVRSYGPFVMNDQRGIMNALQEAQSGAWGELKEHWSE